MALLKAEHITKSFAGVHALRDASFELRPGEVHALVGENGAGKSTLIRVFTGAVIPDSGEILLDGTKIAENSPSISPRVHPSGEPQSMTRQRPTNRPRPNARSSCRRAACS